LASDFLILAIDLAAAVFPVLQFGQDCSGEEKRKARKTQTCWAFSMVSSTWFLLWNC